MFKVGSDAICSYCRSALVTWLFFVCQSHAARLRQVEAEQMSDLEAWQAEAIKKVWSDHGVQRCYERRREFQISDSAK